MLNYVSSKTKSIKFFKCRNFQFIKWIGSVAKYIVNQAIWRNEVIIKENSLDNELPDSISDEEAERLKADLKRLNADPEWAGEDGLRYQAFFERINKALEGILMQ